jgi:hypothetical protein
MISRATLPKTLLVGMETMNPYLKMDLQTLLLKNGRRFWTRELKGRTRKPARTRKSNKRNRRNSCVDKPNMGQHGLNKVASYPLLQIPQMEAHDAVAVTQTRTVNCKRLVETVAISTDHPAIKENVPILSHMPTLSLISIYPEDHKVEVMTKPKRKVPTTVISRIFTKAV